MTDSQNYNPNTQTRVVYTNVAPPQQVQYVNTGPGGHFESRPYVGPITALMILFFFPFGLIGLCNPCDVQQDVAYANPVPAAVVPEPTAPGVDKSLPKTEFVHDNSNVATSPNLHGKAGAFKDDLAQLTYLLGQSESINNDELTATILNAFKILYRKDINRVRVTDQAIHAVVQCVQLTQSCQVAKEACNAVLNMCYEGRVVDEVLRLNGVPHILKHISSKDPEVQASACGALQSICFQDIGRLCLRNIGAIPLIIHVLKQSHDESSWRVLTRLSGLIHNISSDIESISEIRKADGITTIVKLLRAPSASVCASAAGAIQNLSRDYKCREEIMASATTVESLSDLLFSNDINCSSCACGALMNLVGPRFDAAAKSSGHTRSSSESNKREVQRKLRESFKNVLSSCIALGTVYTAINSYHIPLVSEEEGEVDTEVNETMETDMTAQLTEVLQTSDLAKINDRTKTKSKPQHKPTVDLLYE
eukprot:g2023.t1